MEHLGYVTGKDGEVTVNHYFVNSLDCQHLGSLKQPIQRPAGCFFALSPDLRYLTAWDLMWGPELNPQKKWFFFPGFVSPPILSIFATRCSFVLLLVFVSGLRCHWDGRPRDRMQVDGTRPWDDLGSIGAVCRGVLHLERWRSCNKRAGNDDQSWPPADIGSAASILPGDSCCARSREGCSGGEREGDCELPALHSRGSLVHDLHVGRRGVFDAWFWWWLCFHSKTSCSTKYSIAKPSLTQ